MPVKSASGRYISFRYKPSYLDDDPHFKPIFKSEMNRETFGFAAKIFNKAVVPNCISEIAIYGGGLNCISWET